MKGVFCIEGFWYGDHRDTTSVYPVLDLVRRYQNMPFLHHKVTRTKSFALASADGNNEDSIGSTPCFTWRFMAKKDSSKLARRT